MKQRLRQLPLVITVLTAPLALANTPAPGAPQPESYLKPEELPNSLLLVPPPPARESPAFALDAALSQRALTMQNTVAWTQAILDADLKFPATAGTFSCALGLPISEETTPKLVKLLRKMLPDAGRATAAPKHFYKRKRPFLDNGQALCTPAELDYFLKDGSYPSGHASIGMAWALVLTEIAPEKSEALLTRGISLGLSRVICNIHWLSDTREGRNLGASTLARLHSHPDFNADLAEARQEVQALRNAGLTPNRDCEAEAAAMALQQSLLKDVQEGRLSEEGTH